MYPVRELLLKTPSVNYTSISKLQTLVRGVTSLFMSTFLILHNIRSAHNVGSIFRTADGAGVSKIYLSGYTPSPVDRFGRVQPEIKKTSLGASGTVPYESVEDIQTLLLRMKEDGIVVVAVEQTERAIDFKTFVQRGDVAYIFGNEITGVEPEILEKVEEHIMIPMQGSKESLNVSVCVGIILFSKQR